MMVDVRDYRAVLFDFDGTLADSFDAIAASVNHVRGLHGLPPLSVPEVTRHVGRGPIYLVEHTVPAGESMMNVDAYRAHHPTIMVQMTQLLPGAAELLHGLHRLGRCVGLCSNKPRAFSRGLLAHFGVADCFSVVLGPEDVVHPKPAPDMLQKAVALLELPRDQVLYVGDMTVDVETARAAGVAVWAVATGSQSRATLEQARPDRLLGDLREAVAELI